MSEQYNLRNRGLDLEGQLGQNVNGQPGSQPGNQAGFATGSQAIMLRTGFYDPAFREMADQVGGFRNGLETESKELELILREASTVARQYHSNGFYEFLMHVPGFYEFAERQIIKKNGNAPAKATERAEKTLSVVVGYIDGLVDRKNDAVRIIKKTKELADDSITQIDIYAGKLESDKAQLDNKQAKYNAMDEPTRISPSGYRLHNEILDLKVQLQEDQIVLNRYNNTLVNSMAVSSQAAQVTEYMYTMLKGIQSVADTHSFVLDTTKDLLPDLTYMAKMADALQKHMGEYKGWKEILNTYHVAAEKIAVHIVKMCERENGVYLNPYYMEEASRIGAVGAETANRMMQRNADRASTIRAFLAGKGRK